MFSNSASLVLQGKPAEMIVSNEDLLIEILARLPIRSLLRFKCVSKHWRSLISSPYFSQRLNQTSITSALFLQIPSLQNNPEFHFLSLDGKLSPRPFRSLTFADDPAGVMILQSCNGLFFCCSCQADDTRRNYYIYNPTTNKYTVLPKPEGKILHAVFGVYLAFDPSKSPGYKVVLVRSSNSLLQRYQIEIYSSATGLWRLSGDPFQAISNFSHGVFCHGAMHWMSNAGAFICFDVDQERFRDMPTIEIADGWSITNCRYFGESRDCLHLVFSNGSCHNDNKLFDIYELERDYSRWVLKHRVDLNPFLLAYPAMRQSYAYFHPSEWDYAFGVLAVVCREKDEDSFLVLHISGKAIYYSFKDRPLKLYDFAPGFIDNVRAYAHIETLYEV